MDEKIAVNTNRFITLVATTLALLLVSAQSAYAYLDPGTGSYVLQVLVGVVFGAWFSLKVFGNKIKAFLRNLLCRGPGE